MATSRGNRRNNYGFPQQGPPYNNPRPNQGGNAILPFMHTGQPQRAPLIQQNPAMMGLPPHGATPFVPGNPHGGRNLPQIMYPPPTQLMGNRPSPFVHPNQFQQPQMAPNQYYPNPTPPPTIPPTPQIITNPAPPHTTGSKGSSSLVSYPQQSASPYHQPQQIQATSKKRSNAIAIINPDTREEVSVDDKNSNKASGSGLLNSVSNTSVSSSGSRSNVAVEFQSKVQGALNPENPSATPKPNAIISVPGVTDTGTTGTGTLGTGTTGTGTLGTGTTGTGTLGTGTTGTGTTGTGTTGTGTTGTGTTGITTTGITTGVTKPSTSSTTDVSTSPVDSIKDKPQQSEQTDSKPDDVTLPQELSESSQTVLKPNPPQTEPSPVTKLDNNSPPVTTTPLISTDNTTTDQQLSVSDSSNTEAVSTLTSTNTSIPITTTTKTTTDNKTMSSSASKSPKISTKVTDGSESPSMQPSKEAVKNEPQTQIKTAIQPSSQEVPVTSTTTPEVVAPAKLPAPDRKSNRRESPESSRQTPKSSNDSAKEETSKQKSNKGQQAERQGGHREERKKQEEHTVVSEKTSLLGEPKVPPMVVASSPASSELEEGEIPPTSDDEDIDTKHMNGELDEVDYDPNHDDYKYDRKFLLEYRRLATEPPEKLRQMLDVFCPHGTDMSAINYNPSRKSSTKASKKVIEHKPQVYEKVELHKAEHRWVRPTDQAIPEDEQDAQDLFRKFQGILNKLTPQKFSDLAVKAQALAIDSEEKLQGCIDRIFKKALEEPSFSIAYANLCRVLSTIKVVVSRNDEDGNEVIKETSFRRELLTKCQKEFEKEKKDDITREVHLKAIADAPTEEKKKKQEEFDEWETIARRRSLGNIRFIGELFKLKMLSEGIMHDCILRLLRSTSDHESLECFCRLITTTGKELDHTQAKVRMDKYFERINEIIEKKKISSRIKFMLQDVQDLRKSDWVPRRQEGLKTIDQIHHEAKIEALQEQEMIKQMAVVGSVKSYPREDKKKGSKSSGQDDSSSTRARYEKRGSAADVNKILAIRKKEGGSSPSLGPGGGPGLRPSWGNRRKDGQTPPPGEKERAPTKTAPQKSNSAGTGSKKQTGGQVTSGRAGTQGTRRSSSQPSDKQSVFDAIKAIVVPGTVTPAATNVATNVKKPSVDALDEDTVRRKTGTIVDEFAENKDHKEAIDCITELESPGLLNVFVSESILHSLEKSSHHREYVGILLDYAFNEGLLLKDKIHSGLKEVIDIVDDLEVDIPKVWDFLGEILCPLFLSQCLVLTDYSEMIMEAGIGYKAPKALSRLLQQCAHKKSKGAASDIWVKSKLSWKSVGLEDEEDEFLEREKLEFLTSSVATTATVSTSSGPSPSTFEDPPYFKDLVVLFGRVDTSNDDILEWIKNQKIKMDLLFIRSLSRASVEASVSGEGDNCILSDENFRKRLPIVKKSVDENAEYQLEVLNAMQYTMERLKHPPSMLSTVFWSLYDVEVVSETACYEWQKKGKESSGSGMALQTAKPFFEWLGSADQESDNET